MSMFQPQAEDQMHQATPGFAADASAADRSQFLVKTYFHLVGAVLAFIGIEAALMATPGIENLAMSMVQGYTWLLVLGGFLLVSYIAERMARSAASLSTQYLGLALYVCAEAVLFVPLIYIASRFAGPNVIPIAGAATITLFALMSFIVFVTRADFSFLRAALFFGGLVAMGLIACSVIFGFSLGIIFVVAMIGFACLFILYDTSQVLHHYRTDQYVSASLALFASLALLFWYVLRLAMILYSEE